MAKPKITATPDPVTAGDILTVCYEDADVEWSTEIRVRFAFGDHDPEVSDHPVDQGHRCFTIRVPSDAKGCLLQDLGGGAQDIAVTVTPP